MKKIVIPNSKKQMLDTYDMVDGFIIGINNMSVNTVYNIDISEISSLDFSKEIFISLNKNMENKDLDKLEKILITLNNYPIKGVLYSDVCFINLHKRLHLNYDLVWAQEHLTTNYRTINYWNQFNVNCVYLSSDITLKDVLDIRRNTNCKLMVNIFGYLPMFVSKRHIVKNYLNQFKINDSSLVNYISKEDKVYPIVDNDIGTFAYSSNVLNGVCDYYTLSDALIDYVLINGFGIDDDIFVKVVSMINNLSLNNIDKCSSDIDNLIANTDTFFMYKDTISKVRK